MINKIGKLKKFKKELGQLAALHQCPYCMKRQKEVLEHQAQGHPEEEPKEAK